jgi:hypothetical protein
MCRSPQVRASILFASGRDGVQGGRGANGNGDPLIGGRPWGAGMAVRTHGTVHENRGRCEREGGEGKEGTQHLLAQHHGAQGKGRAAGNVRTDERGQGQRRSQWATTRSTRAQDWREASPRNTTSHEQKLARPQAKQTHHVLTHTDTKHAQRHRHTLTAKTEEKRNKEKIPPRLGGPDPANGGGHTHTPQAASPPPLRRRGTG